MLNRNTSSKPKNGRKSMPCRKRSCRRWKLRNWRTWDLTKKRTLSCPIVVGRWFYHCPRSRAWEGGELVYRGQVLGRKKKKKGADFCFWLLFFEWGYDSVKKTLKKAKWNVEVAANKLMKWSLSSIKRIKCGSVGLEWNTFLIFICPLWGAHSSWKTS